MTAHHPLETVPTITWNTQTSSMSSMAAGSERLLIAAEI
jgi:hypothetical protein